MTGGMKSVSNAETTVTLDDIDIKVTYNATHIPAKLYGEPEDCHEREDEMEITSAKFDGDDVMDELSPDELTSVKEQCWDHFWDTLHEWMA